MEENAAENALRTEVVSLGKGRSNVSSKLSVERPLTLLQAPGPLSDVQRRVLAALLPMCCLPYVRSLAPSIQDAQLFKRGSLQKQEWLIGFLLAWGKERVLLKSLQFFSL